MTRRFGHSAPQPPLDPGQVRGQALRLLNRRDYAAAELRTRLEEAGATAEHAAVAVQALAAEGLLSDRRFAEGFVRAHAARGHGPVRIAHELRERGVEAGEIEAALADEDWAARAREVRIRRFGRAAPGSWAERARQARFLQYRGFSSDHIRLATGSSCDE